MAIKSEFPDATGQDLFETWSATADGHDPRATRSTWRSIKAGGGVGIGTLLHLAKEHGFVLPKASEAPAAPSPEVLAQREREKAERGRAEQARQQAAHAAAAADAAAQWDAASDTGASPYLTRKGVQAHGVRFAPDGCALVPLRDAAGALWNLQRIVPERRADGPEKLFLTGGRKSGLWHWCGDPTGASVLLLAEGYATAASLYQATGRPVAVAFDAGNLAHVAKALRQQHRAALLVLCGDDDRDTEARTGTNTGRVKAEAAARAVRGLAVFPEGLPDGGSDFNDMHQAQGLQAVGACVEAAIAAHQAEQKVGSRKASSSTQSQKAVGSEQQGLQPSGNFERFFEVPGDGIYFNPPGDDGGAPRRVCGVLRVVGMARDSQENQAALLLEFVTQFGKMRRWLMPLAMLAGDGNAYRTALLQQGFMAPTDSRRRAWLTEYLQSRPPQSLELIRHVSRVGWFGRCYVLPDETLGANHDGERVIFHSETGIEANFSKRGSLDKWQQNLSRLCVGNSRATFAVATAFAGPLLAWANGVTGGGVHYVGNSSIGKTTCFLLAASVWGKGTEKDPDSYMQKWLATKNGLESQAEQHNDCTLILDEIGQIEAAESGKAAYMLADGMGKSRAKGAGGLRPKATWRLLFLSSGELTLAQHMESVGQKMKSGQEVRLIPIPTEVREGSALEYFHEFDTGHDVSGWVQSHAARCYGVAGRAWLEHLVASTEGLSATLRERMDAIEARLVPLSASGQVKRAGRRFALIAAAGEMATEAGITNWPAGESERGARACFDAWLAARGGAGNGEVTAMLRAVRRFLESHGEGRFTWWHRAADDHNAKTLHRAGYRRLMDKSGKPVKNDAEHQREYGERMTPADGEGVSTEYFVFAEVFRSEVCQGFDYQAVCRVLLEHQCLIPEAGRPFDCKPRLPGMGNARCYRIAPALFELDL
jgi:putative DNA primase/helicase